MSTETQKKSVAAAAATGIHLVASAIKKAAEKKRSRSSTGSSGQDQKPAANE
ncbi:MAG: hypothetical protein MOB07_19290 [Acidobacteria bacterium]|nr:hypothetical protein [Acidobacteriota bacterium]